MRSKEYAPTVFWLVLALGLTTLCATPAPRQTTGDAPSASQTSIASEPTPAWLPFPVPSRLYEYWRKYGPWDYKQQGFKYRDCTRFNFGATGGAAGFSKDALLALANAANPSPTDIQRMAKAELETQFVPNADGLEQLRVMAVQDQRLVRIADDFTYLDNESKWPRQNVGITESRWNEYRSIFHKLSLKEGIVRTEDFPHAIFFVAVARGLCTGGSSAGYVYSTEKLSPVSDSPTQTLDSDAREKPGRHYAYAFRELKPNWYVFYELDW